MEQYNLSNISAKEFNAFLNQAMLIHFDEGNQVPSSVIRVTELESYSPLERGPFSVEFQTTGDETYRPQGIYKINHPEIKDLNVFLVPVGKDVNGMKYEAVFS